MTTLNDEILRVTGGPTVNDGLMSFFGGSGSLNDRERQWLLDQGATLGPVNDMWMQVLAEPAYSGTLNDRLFSFWLSGGGVTNLYPNPTLEGGSNIVADVYSTLPTSHVATPFGGVPCDATYLGAGNPAYTFVGTGNSRFALGVNVNTATNRGVTLPAGRTYRFSATIQAIGEAAVATRLINIASPTNGAAIIGNPLIVPDGTPQNFAIDFIIPAADSTVQLRHGMGMFNGVTTVGATQQTTNLFLRDIGPIV